MLLAVSLAVSPLGDAAVRDVPGGSLCAGCPLCRAPPGPEGSEPGGPASPAPWAATRAAHPAPGAASGSRGEAGNIMLELIREARSDSSWNGQRLYTGRARRCYAACINHELGSRDIPGDAGCWLAQLESGFVSSF